MIWFLHDLGRLAQERTAIEEIQAKATWLQGASWHLKGSGLVLDADIEAHGYLYAVRMIYPPTFPANPPSVWPRVEDEGSGLWSAHQYGRDGDLCLEWGPDTWKPDVTGAQVLESAHRLLEQENPKGVAHGESEFVVAPSRHVPTMGQYMRVAAFRFLATAALRERLKALPTGTHGEIEVLALLSQHETITALVRELRSDENDSWSDSSLPSRLKTYSVAWPGLFVKTDLPETELRVDTLKAFRAAVENHTLFSMRLDVVLKESGTATMMLVQDKVEGLHLFKIGADNNQLIRFRSLELPPERQWERLGLESEGLAAKSVGVVGLGSAGSKIALTLARSGVTQFVLVDSDLFLPENLVRHTLDWRNVGEHKVIAVEDQLMLISPLVKVDTRRIQLTGQESTASVAGALAALAGCDLIIDATADSSTFNQLAMVAVQYSRALVWLEVYAGGIGGMVARYRPGKDADPHEMREQFHAFTANIEAPPPATMNPMEPYSAAPVTAGPPLVASDADVAVIAHQAARLALDALAEREPSTFPYSMYLIGLARSWVFDQAFQTIPIETGPPSASIPPGAPAEVVDDGVSFVTELLEAQNGRTTAS